VPDSLSLTKESRALKRRVAAMLECALGFAFRAAAYWSRHPVARLRPDGRRRVLIVAPHPDDEAIGCAGTAMLHVDAGDHVCIAIATDGRLYPSVPTADEVAMIRRHEAEHAARLMQVERLVWIGLPEGAWDLSQLKTSLGALLIETRPDIVYAPSRLDFHPEHLKVAHALALALEDLDGMEPSVRVYQIQVPLTTLLVNLVSDVSSMRARCDAVLDAYASQVSSVQCTYRQRYYAARRHGISTLAEEFWQIPAKRYIRLHRAPPTQPSKAFRGMRPFPLSDPLAFLFGRQERRIIGSSGLES